MSTLRSIAVSVEEPKPGRFRWVLIERDASGWQALDRAAAPVASYQRAMADGLLALQALVPDLDAGPRAGDDEDVQADAAPARPDGAAHAHRQPARPASPASSKPYFGFGPAR